MAPVPAFTVVVPVTVTVPAVWLIAVSVLDKARLPVAVTFLSSEKPAVPVNEIFPPINTAIFVRVVPASSVMSPSAPATPPLAPAPPVAVIV